MKIKIFDLDYEIVKFDSDLDSSMGHSWYKGQKIGISSETSLEQNKNTLLHEILHMISDAARIELTENQISTIATGLNPIVGKELEKYLVEQTKAEYLESFNKK